MLRLAPLALLLVAVAIVSGCEVNTEGDNLVNGKKLFIGQGRCGSCHALARAGTKGTAGPDLDQAFQRSLADGFKRSTLKGIVHQQILYPNKNPQVDPETEKEVTSMPPDLVTGQDAYDVAAYVAESVAKPGKDSGLLATAVKPAGAGKPIAEKNGTLQIDADPNGQLAYISNKATGTAGKITVKMANKTSTPHDIVIDGKGKGQIVTNGGTSQFSANFTAGTYTFYCSVDGHRQAGMQGKLTVK
jgi:plastocyanin